MKKTLNIKWSQASVTREEKEKLLSQKGALLWFTGLSASGKSTLANGIERRLFESGLLTVVLDGDNIRHGLNSDLGFSKEDRAENIRRIGEVAKLFVETGIITITAFISPYRKDRDRVRAILRDGDFIEIYLKCPLAELKRRDPKGLYLKAETGVITDFTGISDVYEEPLNPEISLDTSKFSPRECIERIVEYLRSRDFTKN